MSKNNYKVYAHIVKKEISGYKYDKYYIGISNRKNLNDRWGAKGQGYKTQPFYRAIKKYGWDNIEHKILFTDLDAETANSIECALISSLDCMLGHKGYNCTSGGDGVKDCEKIKCTNVYCVELNRAFKNSQIASQITGDNGSTIQTNCSLYNRTGHIPDKRTVKYTYCTIDNIYKFFNINGERIKVTHGLRPLVLLSDGKIYGSIRTMKEITGFSCNRNSILTYDKYQKYKKKNTLYTRERCMYLEDYLRVFDFTN